MFVNRNARHIIEYVQQTGVGEQKCREAVRLNGKVKFLAEVHDFVLSDEWYRLEISNLVAYNHV
jgi:hypothetical protein